MTSRSTFMRLQEEMGTVAEEEQGILLAGGLAREVLRDVE
jgi:hypothetical protein